MTDPWQHAPPEWTYPDDTPTRVTIRELAARIHASKGPNAGGVLGQRVEGPVIVYWKGPPPDGLRRLAAQQPVPVSFEEAAYALDELMPIAKQFMDDHGDVLASTGPLKDYSGVSIWVWTDPGVDPEALVAALSAEVGVPVVCDRTMPRDAQPWGSRSGA
ncbi:hypothetical protein E1263_41850 [Kribbella antibiotica]|uniref:Uncharacterized protein n=1 Tax=Kribbella antibiotica TaxID=190195 RepID=A0A4R4YEQ6_9ACTN|nr:hypothetical protein [Kribbella antibiotica]TDD43126.1 hypothetical protein E1263_41850 [Kribbella antibiotica]